MKKRQFPSCICIYVILAGFFLAVTSCTSFPGASLADEQPDTRNRSGAAESSTAKEESGIEKAEEKIPARKINGSIDLRAESVRDFVYTEPRNGEPVFLAVVPRRAHREEEYEYALWEIARQGALYRRLEVSAQFITAQTAADFGHDEKITVHVDNALIEAMREKVVPLEHFQDNRQSLVSGRIEGLSIPNYSVDRSMRDGLPLWIYTPPGIEGYYTTVGAVERKYLLSDSIRAADKKAMANLARQRRLKVDNYSDQLRSSAGAGYREFNLEVSEARLEGFYVLARWYSPKENLFYSLAACAKAD
ncbi:MAG: hypothetical protein ACLFMZ_07425 [Spirochaetaceae bacterium]